MRSSGLLGVSIHTQRRRLRERCGANRRLIGEVDELDLALAAAAPGVEQTIGAAVAVVRRDDARPDGNEITDHA